MNKIISLKQLCIDNIISKNLYFENLSFFLIKEIKYYRMQNIFNTLNYFIFKNENDILPELYYQDQFYDKILYHLSQISKRKYSLYEINPDGKIIKIYEDNNKKKCYRYAKQFHLDDFIIFNENILIEWDKQCRE
jgi:hypothetical protein